MTARDPASLEHDDRFLPGAHLPAVGAHADGDRGDDWRFDPATGTVFGRDVTTGGPQLHGDRRASRARRRRCWPPPPLPPDNRVQQQLHGAAASSTRGSSATVADVVGDASTPYERVRQIHAFLTDRANGFRYSLSTAPGTSGNDLVDFLTAAARATASSTPARWRCMVRAAGRAGPGGPGLHAGRACSPTARRLITSDDAHAWVEVYFQCLGWVPFDPTPISADRAVDLPWAPRADAPTGADSGAAPPAPGRADRGRPDRRARTAPATARRSPTRAAADAGDAVAAAGRRPAVLVLVAAASRRPPGIRVLQRRRRLAAGHGRRAVGRAGGHRARPGRAGCSRPGRRGARRSELGRRWPAAAATRPAAPRTPSRGWPGRRRRPATGRPAATAAGPGAGRRPAHGAARAAAVGVARRPAARPAVAGLAGAGAGAAVGRARPGGRLARPVPRPRRPARRSTPTAAVPEDGGCRESVRLLVVAAAEALLEAVLQRLAAGPAAAAGPAGGRRAAAAGGRAAGLDGAGGGLVVEDAEGDAAEGDQGAERRRRDRLGDGAADEDGQADDDQDGAELQLAAGLQPAVAGADGRGELGIVIDEGALDLLQQTLLVLGERHVDLQVGGAKAVGGSRRRYSRGYEPFATARKATVAATRRELAVITPSGCPPERPAPAPGGVRSAARPAVPVQQGRRPHRAGTEPAGRPVGGQLGVPPAVLAGAELELLRRGVRRRPAARPAPRPAGCGPGPGPSASKRARAVS